MRNERAFGRPGGTTGVNQHGGIIRRSFHQWKSAGHHEALQREIDIAMLCCIAHADQAAKLWALLASGEHATGGALIHNRHHGT